MEKYQGIHRMCDKTGLKLKEVLVYLKLAKQCF